MSRSITLGQYLPGHSFLHLLNPRFKIVALIIILVLLFTVDTYEALVFMLLAAFFLAAVCGVPFRFFIRALRPILVISLFALVVYLFFTKGGEVLFRIGVITVESEGVRQGFFVILRLVCLVLYSVLATMTTTPLALTNAMGFFLKPLTILKVPTDELVMIMAVALRFIPTLMEESGRLMRAQLARGADFETGSLFRRAGNLVPLIVPLFISAFRRADALALAMEARGFRLGAKRTRMHEDVIALRDWLSIIVVTFLLAAGLFFDL